MKLNFFTIMPLLIIAFLVLYVIFIEIGLINGSDLDLIIAYICIGVNIILAILLHVFSKLLDEFSNL